MTGFGLCCAGAWHDTSVHLHSINQSHEDGPITGTQQFLFESKVSPVIHWKRKTCACWTKFSTQPAGFKNWSKKNNRWKQTNPQLQRLKAASGFCFLGHPLLLHRSKAVRPMALCTFYQVRVTFRWRRLRSRMYFTRFYSRRSRWGVFFLTCFFLMIVIQWLQSHQTLTCIPQSSYPSRLKTWIFWAPNVF